MIHPRNAGFSAQSRMRVAAAAILALVVCDAARAVDAPALRRKQDAQERAREMARQLVTGILDVQLQQLEENGLVELPLYREVAAMKKNVGALVDHEMERAVELLVEAQRAGAGAGDRERAFKQARELIREIVTRLSAERQNLLRRLKSAELGAQVKRLIEFQSKVWHSTSTLSDQPLARQEAIALAVIEDQSDAKQLFMQFVETLTDVSAWDGPLGAGDSDGLRVVHAASIGQQLDEAGAMLDALRYAEAAARQQRALKGLRLLQERLDDTQGLTGDDRNAALALTAALSERQENLRERTKEADLSLPEAERLVEEQAALRKDLNKLAQTAGSAPAAEPLLEQAKSAAYEATGRLFAARQDEALAQQTKVLANLAEIADQLSHAPDADDSGKSAAELAQQAEHLQEVKSDVDQLRKKQAEIGQTASGDASLAARHERENARELTKFNGNRHLPKSVLSRLASAAHAAENAALTLENRAADGNEKSQRMALETADRAVERAAAEISAALDDARRMGMAVKIGELSRAAETLERAAAAERDAAAAALSAANRKGLNADDAKKLADRQSDLERIARKTGEALESTAAEAAQQARDGANAAGVARDALEKAAGNEGPESNSAAREAAASCASAAAKLSQAAAELRRQVDKSAES